MTNVGALQSGVPLPREAASPSLVEVQEGPSFAEWLDARQDRRPFGNGTMHASVDAFAAGGLIAATSPVVQTADGATATAAAPVVAPRDDAAAGMAVVEARPMSDALASRGEMGRPMTVAVGALQEVHAVSLPSSHGGASALQATSFAIPHAAVLLPEADAAEPASRPAARATRAPAPATVTVTLDDEAAGAVVAISGDTAPGDEDALLRAVTRLLAQHGLTLDELRVARRPAHDGQRRDGQEQGKR